MVPLGEEYRKPQFKMLVLGSHRPPGFAFTLPGRGEGTARQTLLAWPGEGPPFFPPVGPPPGRANKGSNPLAGGSWVCSLLSMEGTEARQHLPWGPPLWSFSCQELMLPPRPQRLPGCLLIIGTFLVTAFTLLFQLSVGVFFFSHLTSKFTPLSLLALLSGGVDGCLAGWKEGGWLPTGSRSSSAR